MPQKIANFKCVAVKKQFFELLAVFINVLSKLGITLCHDHETSLPTECQMPPDTNDCGSEEKRWFYHHNVRSCTEYTYRGCERSTNNFKTKEECEKLCLPPFGMYQQEFENCENFDLLI